MAGADQAGPRIELSYVDAAHGRRRRPLRGCVTGRFEDVDPVRTFRWSRGERHFPGWYWAATTGRYVGLESRLERERRRAPGYFVRRTEGSAVVVDVRADELTRRTSRRSR